MSEVNVTNSNFDEEVINSDKPVLIDFWASWCGPCTMLSPIVAEIAKEHPEIKVCKVNVDEEIELSNRYHVASIPMLLVMKDGNVIGKSVGMRPKNQIVDMILESLK